ncbi:MAG: VanZ family protein [Burkholderiaceae bacterium]|nr:VanZ family protein [Burkholderiaceae bacterium]
MTIDPSSRPSRLPHAALVTYVIALVVGTLYPMSGWHSSGLPVFGFLLDPWPRWWTWFDIVFNVVVYLPGGLLLAIVLREHHRARFAVLLAVLICSTTAVSLEALQSLLPNRVPSRMDWLANTAGAWIGALLAPLGARLAARGQQTLDQRMAIDGTDSAIGTTLLGIWLLIQWPAQRLMFGHGDLLHEFVALADLVGLHTSAAEWRLGAEHTVFAEALGVAMAVASIGLLVREVLPTRAPRAAVTAALLFAAVSVKTVATATMVGPGKAVGWLTAGAQGGLLTGAVFLALLSAAQRATRLRLAMGALALNSLLTTVFPFDTYYASALPPWETSSWRNIDGLLRTASCLWPYATIAWCAQRLRSLGGARQRGRSIIRRTS